MTDNQDKCPTCGSRVRVNEYARTSRIIDWLKQEKKKPANIEFTEGPERQVAYHIEMALEEQGKAVREATIRQCAEIVEELHCCEDCPCGYHYNEILSLLPNESPKKPKKEME